LLSSICTTFPSSSVRYISPPNILSFQDTEQPSALRWFSCACLSVGGWVGGSVGRSVYLYIDSTVHTSSIVSMCIDNSTKNPNKTTNTANQL
jgi:hypothetical protein